MRSLKWIAVAAPVLGAVIGCGGGRQEIPLADVPQVELNVTDEQNLPPQVPANHASPRAQ